MLIGVTMCFLSQPTCVLDTSTYIVNPFYSMVMRSIICNEWNGGISYNKYYTCNTLNTFAYIHPCPISFCIRVHNFIRNGWRRNIVRHVISAYTTSILNMLSCLQYIGYKHERPSTSFWALLEVSSLTPSVLLLSLQHSCTLFSLHGHTTKCVFGLHMVWLVWPLRCSWSLHFRFGISLFCPESIFLSVVYILCCSVLCSAHHSLPYIRVGLVTIFYNLFFSLT